MIRALAKSKLTGTFFLNTRAPHKKISLLPYHHHSSFFSFVEQKPKLPRNKQEAWMMQEQQKVKQLPEDDQDEGKSYKGVYKSGIAVFFALVAALGYLVLKADRTSQEQLEVFEEEITGLKEAKEKQNVIGGQWTLIDTEGRPFSSRLLQGNYYLIYFGYTNSPSTTPSNLYYLSTVYRVIRNLPEGAYLKLKIVFVSIDPQRDTPQHLKQYLSHFNKNIIGVTGSVPNDIEVRSCMKNFDIKSKKVPTTLGDKHYEIVHTNRVCLMDTENNFLYQLDPTLTEQQAAKAIVSRIISTQHLKEKQMQKSGL